jgi:phospholipase A-2-activating protein
MQAKVWTNDTVAATLAGHEAAVWSVAVTPDSLVLTGSADRTIKMWQSNGYEPGLAHSVVTDAEWRSRPGEPYAACRLCVRTFPGHTDCVRALVIAPELGFASAGNDCTVRMWAYSGECLAVLNGHEGFVYALVRARCALAGVLWA